MKTNFEIKAVQLDLARQMESMNFIFQFIDFIAEKDYNTLFLYLEWRVRTKTFDIGAKDGYSPEQIKKIVKYAETRGIDIIPGLASIGHAELLLQNKKFQHLCELRGDRIGRFWGSPKMEFCPSLPETREFLEAYFCEVAELFPSKYLHIGGDESFNIGYCDLCAEKAKTYEGEQALYGDHIQFCYSVVTGKLGKRMMMWDDMIELYPDVFKKFPRDIIMVNWQYQMNAVQWKGHFTNLDFRDQMSYYEKEGFDYVIAPADYHWSNIETLTASTQGRKCMGGILTTWEKKDRLMQKYFPIIAATGALWSDDAEGSSEMILHSAMSNLFGTEDEIFLHAIEQYLEFYGKGRKIGPQTMTLHPFDGPDWEHMRSLRTIAGILLKYQDQFAGTFAGMIVDDIVADLLMQEAAGRLQIASYKMLNGQETESFDEIAADIAAVWEHNIAACKQIRTARDAAFFRSLQEDFLKYIADFEEKMETCGRVDVLYVLPDLYEAERITIRLKAGGKWVDVAAGVFKHKDQAMYSVTYFIPKNIAPSEIEIFAEGYGGQGIAYVTVKTDKGTYVPKGVLSVTGEVWRADHMLAADCTFAFLGFQKTLDAFHDRTKAYLKSSVKLLLEKQK
ncbi:MAG: family 20 glycosylhydrolase [Lentisphaeria bacterium]|nr:family 20 glycosylhydrolase [Lentisphaeria bacterium]